MIFSLQPQVQQTASHIAFYNEAALNNIIACVYSQGSIHGGAGGKLPPQSTQLLPQRRVARQKREREGEGGGVKRILFEIHVNSILLDYVKEHTC